MTPLEAAILCWRSYRDPPSYARGGSFVNLSETDGVINAVYRGTKPTYLPDLLADIDAVPVSDDELGCVPRGFLADAIGTLEQLVADIGDKPLRIIGHSKGGADGTHAAGKLAARGRPPLELITFGRPNCGRGKLARLLAPIAGRDYRHGDDPVPSLPPFFRQPRLLVQLGARTLKLDVIEDHYCESYIQSLGGTAPLA